MIWLLFKLFYIFVDDLFNQDVSELNINKAVKTNINKFIEKYNNYIYINCFWLIECADNVFSLG